jgi:integrase/recombinase XerD
MMKADSFRAHAARYLVSLSALGFSPATVTTRRQYLERFIAWCEERGVAEPSEVTRPVLERYRRHLFYARKSNGQPLSFRSQAQLLIPLRTFFKWLARENLILSNPASELELPKVEKRLPAATLSIDEAERLMAAPDTTDEIGLRDRAILEVFYATAIRRTEIVGLKVVDIDWERATLMIRQGKGRKDRLVPLGARAKNWLRTYCDRARPALIAGRDEGTLFLTREGRPLETFMLTRDVRRYLIAAGIEKPGSCHLLRHTTATLMLEGGADIRFIQALLGHEKLETTTIYTKVSISKLIEVHAATHPGVRSQADRDILEAALADEDEPDD